MNNPSDRIGMLKQIFVCLAEKGLENSSVRDFSKYTGKNASSLYYWFKGKDEIIIETTKYAISVILNKSFCDSFKNIKSINEFCDKLIVGMEKYVEYLNIIVQVITSPYYGAIMIEELKRHKEVYFDRVNEVAKKIDAPENEKNVAMQIYLSIIFKNTIAKNWVIMKKEIKFFSKLLIDRGYLAIELE